MSGTSRFAAALVSLLLVPGCASHQAPDHFLPTVREAQREVFGGWIELSVRDQGGLQRLAGELIAVSLDSLWVLDGSGGTAVGTDAVEEGKLVAYNSEWGRVAGGAALGTLSTISNGVFLIFTAPMWIVGGSIAASSQSRLPIQKLPDTGWFALIPFARFPQGMPPGVELRSLRPKRGQRR